EVLERTKAIDEGIEVILVTAVKTVRTAVAAMKLGAFDYLTKPFEEDELLQLVRRALEKRSLEREVAFLRAELARTQESEEIVGQHPAMQKLRRVIAQVARTTATVLVSGQSGTGKELIARAIHREGPRRDKPFVAVNPAAIVESLIESELFGHERGAFTSAHARKLGKFELAQGGTLFLDEIGTLKAELQNVIERCVVLAEGPLVQLNDLPLDVLLPEHRLKVRRAERLPLKQASEQFERQVVLRIMERVKGNQSEAARILGVHRNSLKR